MSVILRCPFASLEGFGPEWHQGKGMTCELAGGEIKETHVWMKSK
jgi:hypothetical protein